MQFLEQNGAADNAVWQDTGKTSILTEASTYQGVPVNLKPE